MREADEAQSRKILASTDVPSGASTSMQHVISNKLDMIPLAARTGTELTVESLAGAAVGVGGGSLFFYM